MKLDKDIIDKILKKYLSRTIAVNQFGLRNELLKAQKDQYEKGFIDGSELTGRIAKEEHAIDVADKLKDQREQYEREREAWGSEEIRYLKEIDALKTKRESILKEGKLLEKENILRHIGGLDWRLKKGEAFEELINLIKSDI